MSEDSPKQEKRQILPQDYYDSRQVMRLLRISKQKYYELINRDDDRCRCGCMDGQLVELLPNVASSWPGSSETPYLRVMAKDTEKVELFALPSAVPIGTITLTSCYNISMKVPYMTYEELLSDMLARKGGVLTARGRLGCQHPEEGLLPLHSGKRA